MFLNHTFACVGKRFISTVVLCAFMISTCVMPSRVSAQMLTYGNLPTPGTMLNSSSSFTPVMVKGLKIYADDPLKFDFILDSGNAKVSQSEFQNEGLKLAKYFLAGLTVPEKDLWVNLSPYEKNRIIADSFGQTLLGRDLLAQDYILKQLSSSLIHPDKNLGKAFWSQVYAKAKDLYGTTDIPMNTFNKIWIVPGKANVWENNGMAFVTASRLKVLSEEDYMSTAKHMNVQAVEVTPEKYKTISKASSEVVRQVLIPAIEKEVNEGENFANLRQVYNAMILAVWYKKALKESLLSKVYVNQNKITGVDTDKDSKQNIYNQYLAAFKKGAFNFIREDVDQNNVTIPRKYFSGGADWAGIDRSMNVSNSPFINLSRQEQAAVAGSIGSNGVFTWRAQDQGPQADPDAMAAVEDVMMSAEAGQMNFDGALLAKIAKQITGPGRWTVALDDSIATVGKRFKDFGVGLEASNPEHRQLLRRLMLGRISELKAAGVSSIILDKDTFTNTDANGRLLVDLLREEGIFVGIKSDGGLVKQDEQAGALPGEQYPVDDDNFFNNTLPALLQKYKALGATFTKFRGVIRINAEGQTSDINIRRNAQIQARQAKLSQEHGLVPYVEPEVLVDGKHDIEACRKVTEKVLRATVEELIKAGVELEGIVFKINMVTSGKDANVQADDTTVADLTLETIMKTIPPEVGGLVFLSGGQKDAVKTLHAIEVAMKGRLADIRRKVIQELSQGDDSSHEQLRRLLSSRGKGFIEAGRISASFGRETTADATKQWAGNPVNVQAAQEVLLNKAKAVQAARLGLLGASPEVLAAAILKAEADAQKRNEAMNTEDALFYPVNVLRTYGNSLQEFGLRVQKTEVSFLKSQMTGGERGALENPMTLRALEIANSQALGSILFAGLGQQAKEVADGNSVNLGHRVLMAQVQSDSNIAYVSVGSEGVRDGSVGTPLGRIYWSGYEGGYRNSSNYEDYKNQMEVLKARGVKIYLFKDDGLENTSALKSNLPDAWSLTALEEYDPSKPIPHLLDETRVRRLNLITNNDNPIDFELTDTPRQVFQKIAAANQIDISSPEKWKAFLSKYAVNILGPRKAEDLKLSNNQRHAFYIEGQDGFVALEKEGLRLMIVSDGSLVPGLIAASGIELAGRKLVSFGRHGYVEGEVMVLGASLVQGARVMTKLVSDLKTRDRVAPETMNQVEEGLVADLTNNSGYSPDAFSSVESERDLQSNKSNAAIAITAGTGADQYRYGMEFAKRLPRIVFDEDKKTVTLHTFLMTREGVFVVRTTLVSEDLSASKSAIVQATPAAANFVQEYKNKFGFVALSDALNRGRLKGIVQQVVSAGGGISSVNLSGENLEKQVDHLSRAGVTAVTLDPGNLGNAQLVRSKAMVIGVKAEGVNPLSNGIDLRGKGVGYIEIEEGNSSKRAQVAQEAQKVGIMPVVFSENFSKDLRDTVKALRQQQVWFDAMALKTEMSLMPGADAQTQARQTLKTLLKEVPVEVAAVVLTGLSGNSNLMKSLNAILSMSQAEFETLRDEVVAELKADLRLDDANKIANLIQPPWLISYSLETSLKDESEQRNLQAARLGKLNASVENIDAALKEAELNRIAQRMEPPTGGTMAADEGDAVGGTAEQRLLMVTLHNTNEKRALMRQLFLTTPGLKESGISSVILNWDTFGNQIPEGAQLLVDYVALQGIVPGLKNDKGVVRDLLSKAMPVARSAFQDILFNEASSSLNPNNSQGIWEQVSSGQVRLKSQHFGLKLDDVRRMIGNEAVVAQFWPIVQASLPKETIPNPAWEQFVTDVFGDSKYASAQFTKFRTTQFIDPVNGLPTDENILRNAEVQAAQALRSQASGRLPMVEPEVLITGKHNIQQSYGATTRVLRGTFEVLRRKGVLLKGMILKTSMILSGDAAKDRANPDEVGYWTLKGLLKTVPSSVPAIVFLSGGQGDDEVVANLDGVVRASQTRFTEIRNEVVKELTSEGRYEEAKQVAALSKVPWEISFSFGRGLQRYALMAWAGAQENWSKAQLEVTRQALRTQAARVGRLKEHLRNTSGDKALMISAKGNGNDNALFGKIPAEVLSPERQGGIDWRPEWFDVQIERDPNGVPLPISQQPIGSMRIKGFMPIPIEFKVINIPLLLGVNDRQEVQKLALN